MDRRSFLRGAAASAIAAALPVPVLRPEMFGAIGEPVFVGWDFGRELSRPALRPIFDGAIGVYHGIIFREVANGHS